MECKQCGSLKNVNRNDVCRSCLSKNAWARKERTTIVKKCQECKNEFTVQRSTCVERTKIVRGKIYTYTSGKFCGRKCYQADNARRMKSDQHPTLGKTWRHTEEYKKKLSEARKGKKNPAYKHGSYSGELRRGVQQPQIEWRTAIYKKDNYTCQICKKKNGNGTTTKLNAHHICPWGRCIDLRFDISNGVTLCVDCHKKMHDLLRVSEKTAIVPLDIHYYIAEYKRLSDILNSL